MRTTRSTLSRTSSSNQVFGAQNSAVHPCVVLNRRVQPTNFLCAVCRLLTNLVCESRLGLTNRFMWARHKITDPVSSGCRSQVLLQKVGSSIGSQICWHRTCGAALWVSGHIWIGSSTDRCCFLKCISSFEQFTHLAKLQVCNLQGRI